MDIVRWNPLMLDHSEIIMLYTSYATPCRGIPWDIWQVRYFMVYTPNANMADRSVGARDESNESEASQALMFCFDNAFSEKFCFVVDLVPLFRPPSAFLCSWMPPQQSAIFYSRESVIFFNFGVRLWGETKETEARSSRSPKELLKFGLESILENV